MKATIVLGLSGVLTLAASGCRTERATPATPPPDHTAGFVLDHADQVGCAECHGADACARCHLTRAPRDHVPGYVQGMHGLDARADPTRCATCHTPPSCARCHR
jgi:hypothetical protein